MNEMRAISLWQPWASLCFTAFPGEEFPIKRHETRGWPLPQSMVGQRVIIHAAKNRKGLGRGMDAALHDLCMDAFGCGYNYSLPFGAAIGTARLVLSLRMEECQPTNDSDEIAGDWSDGRFAWRLSEARAFKEPLAMIGRQGFWKPTEDISAALHTQRPALGEQHYHVCEACFRIRCHGTKHIESHICETCGAGPFTDGWLSYRLAHEAMVEMKSQAALASATVAVSQDDARKGLDT
ncbi:MAG: hypothetical protein IT547_18175 [Hyphomonadaceae bacterium]|nr:hypothetical protein [Hyphomonadaceae bacterium]